MEPSTKLSLAEKFLLLALHPEKSKYLISDQALIAGFTGAIFLDLTLEGKLEIYYMRYLTNQSFLELTKNFWKLFTISRRKEKSEPGYNDYQTNRKAIENFYFKTWKPKAW